MSLSLSNNGFEFLKSEEGCVLTAYKLEGETYYTIGYGHYGPDVYAGMTITQAQADELFRTDIKEFEGYVNDYAVSKFSLNQNQFDALVSYCYNRGPGGLQQLVNNSSTITELATNIVVYWGSAETYKDALIARRKREQALFNTPVSDSGGGDTGGSEGSGGGSQGSGTIATKKRKGYNWVLFNSNKRKRFY